MKIGTMTDPKTLVQITCDREGLRIMIQAATAAIQWSDDFNMGDEYDTDVGPYHEMKDALMAKYQEVYGEF